MARPSPCPHRADHCWHTTGAKLPARTDQIVPSSAVWIHQVCCYCNVVQTVNADSLRGQHGPYEPEFLVSTGRIG